MKILVLLLLALSPALHAKPLTYKKSAAKPEYKTGLKMDKEWRKKVQFFNPFALGERGAAPLAQTVDLRTKAKNGYPSIKNQGQCGSCWDFSSIGVLEGTIALEQGKVLNLSEQQALACAGAGSCNGGYFNVMDYFVSNGVTDEAHMPYQGRDTRCVGGMPVVAKAKQWLFVGGTDQQVPTDAQMQYILQYKPLVVTVYADNNFMSYQSGVYNECTMGGTNHMVDLVGYGHDGGGLYYILRNSWGPQWGENGYMRIRPRCNNLAEAAAFVRLN